MWEWTMPKFFSHQPLMPAWCARRVVAFDTISMTCRDGQRNKVRFKPKSAFQSGHPSSELLVPPSTAASDFAVSKTAKRGQVFEVFDHLGQGDDQVSGSPTPVSSFKLAMSRS